MSNEEKIISDISEPNNFETTLLRSTLPEKILNQGKELVIIDSNIADEANAKLRESARVQNIDYNFLIQTQYKLYVEITSPSTVPATTIPDFSGQSRDEKIKLMYSDYFPNGTGTNGEEIVKDAMLIPKYSHLLVIEHLKSVPNLRREVSSVIHRIERAHKPSPIAIILQIDIPVSEFSENDYSLAKDLALELKSRKTALIFNNLGDIDSKDLSKIEQLKSEIKRFGDFEEVAIAPDKSHTAKVFEKMRGSNLQQDLNSQYVAFMSNFMPEIARIEAQTNRDILSKMIQVGNIYKNKSDLYNGKSSLTVFFSVLHGHLSPKLLIDTTLEGSEIYYISTSVSGSISRTNILKFFQAVILNKNITSESFGITSNLDIEDVRLKFRNYFKIELLNFIENAIDSQEKL